MDLGKLFFLCSNFSSSEIMRNLRDYAITFLTSVVNKTASAHWDIQELLDIFQVSAEIEAM